MVSRDAEGLLSVATLVEAKNASHKRRLCPAHSASTLRVEHWGFDKKGAQRSWLTKDGQFHRCFDAAVSRVSPGSPSQKRGVPSLKMGVIPYEKTENEKRIPEIRLDSRQGQLSSPLGPDELPPPLPAEGLSSPAGTTRSSDRMIGGACFGTGLNDLLLEDVDNEEVSDRGDSLEDIFVESFEYESIKPEKPQRGEWFHSYGVNKVVMDTLRAKLGVQETHLSLVCDRHEERPQMEFVKGDVSKNDYLFVLSHELKLRAPSERQQQQDEQLPMQEALTGAEKRPLPLQRRSSTMRLQLDVEKHHDKHQRHRHSNISFRKISPENERVQHGSVSAGLDQSEERARNDEVLLLEEHQVVIFFFPERNLLFSIGDLNIHSPMAEACRDALQNRKSAVLSDLLGDADGSDGTGTLMVVMLDATIDLVFPIMDVYGDALEGLRILTQAQPAYHHLLLSNKLKFQLTQIRRYIWDARGLFMELSQDMCGALGEITRHRMLNLLESTSQLEKEAEANIEQCQMVEAFYSAWQESKMNASLFWLTNFSVALIPIQTMSGWFGMNFAIPDGYLALDGTECDAGKHFPGDPCTWLMPELSWEYSYLVFCGVCITWLVTYCIICYRSTSPAKMIVVESTRASRTAVPSV